MTITPEETPAWNPTSLHLFKSPYPLDGGRQWVLEDHKSNRMNFYTHRIALEVATRRTLGVGRSTVVPLPDGSLILDPFHPRVYQVTPEGGMEVPCPICERKYAPMTLEGLVV